MAEAAKTKRKNVKCALTRFENYFERVKNNPSQTDLDIIELKSRLAKVEFLLDEFDSAQLVIEASDAENEVTHLSQREEFENKYFQITCLAKKYISDLDASNSKRDLDSLTINSSSNAFDLGSVRLPPITIPTFDGSYDNWLFFKDTFASIIHENACLSDIQKFHYIRLSLKGPSSDIVSSLETSSDNYKIA